MNLSAYHSQINTLERDILRLEAKIYSEQKKISDRGSKINNVLKSINKNISLSLRKMKSDQVMRYRKEILACSAKVISYEKQKLNKKDALLKKNGIVKMLELAQQKREHQRMSRSVENLVDYNLVSKSESKKIEEEYIMENKDNSDTIKVFVSYSWDTSEHEEKVFDFVNHLRTNGGFDAQMDKGLSQQQTSINFVKMMYQAVHDFPKVIVVLSEGYKQKADDFAGGVGTEYELMINDINDHSNKYILVSFHGRESNIIPNGFKGRDIVDLSAKGGMTKLYEKLMNHQRFVFAEVAKDKPKLPLSLARPFSTPIIEKESLIEPYISITPIIKAGDLSLTARKYKSIEFRLKFEFLNTMISTIKGFNYIISLPRELDIEHYFDADDNGIVHHEKRYEGKVFQKQRVQTEIFPIKVASQNVTKIIKSVIKVEVFSDFGAIECLFPAVELIKIRPGGESYLEAVTLSPDLFI